MIEKIGRVSNPLTIIAIFATLSEIAATTALAFVSKELQPVFIWFVMLFPTLLVGAFFFTLNRKPKVFYAPSDFRDDQSYLAVNQSFFAIEKMADKSTEIKSTRIPEINLMNTIIQQMDLRILHYLFKAANKLLSIYEHTSLYLESFDIKKSDPDSVAYTVRDAVFQGTVIGMVVALDPILLNRGEYENQSFKITITPTVLQIIETRIKNAGKEHVGAS
ncbi:MAG: hypothetical protein ABSA44_12320 [Bacteroidota bacterium]|jgi:hypothetical protein